MTVSIPDLPLVYLSDHELALVNMLRADMLRDRFALKVRDAYFNGEQLVRDLGISIPPQLKGLHTVIGWPRVGVESLEERLDLEAFRWADGSDSSELAEIADANDLFDESSLAHLDALVYGREYLAVGSGDCGTPDCPPLISAESPLDMTLMWDARLRMGTAALRECAADTYIESGPEERMLVLYLPDQTVMCLPNTSGGWEVVDRDMHGLGVVPVVRMANRQRTADRVGKSEITPEVMSITDAASAAPDGHGGGCRVLRRAAALHLGGVGVGVSGRGRYGEVGLGDVHRPGARSGAGRGRTGPVGGSVRRA